MLYLNKYHLKRLEEKDFPAVKEIFWKVFHKKVSLSYLKNKYNTSYLGVKYICSIAYKGKIPVAFYGAIPQKFSNHSQEILVAHACDSFTLKECQGQGLHFQLATISYELMKENNIKFVYAYHSDNTYHSTKKLGWKEHIHMQRFHVKVPTLPISKILNKLGSNSFYTLFFSEKISKEALEKLQSNSSQFRQKFTKSFIDYKNSFNNHFFIELYDCVFWVKIQSIMNIGLVQAPSETSLKKATRKLRRIAFFLGIKELLFQIDSATPVASYLTKIVVPKKSWLIGYLDFDPTINLEEFLFTYADLDTY